jgi:hypothetical protein
MTHFMRLVPWLCFVLAMLGCSANDNDPAASPVNSSGGASFMSVETGGNSEVSLTTGGGAPVGGNNGTGGSVVFNTGGKAATVGARSTGGSSAYANPCASIPVPHVYVSQMCCCRSYPPESPYYQCYDISTVTDVGPSCG